MTKRECEEEPLDFDAFGPFGLVAIEAASIGLTVDSATTYCVDLTRASLTAVNAVPGLLENSVLSPKGAISMSDEARAACGVPTDAAFVQYCYPLTGMSECSPACLEELEMAIPAVNLMRAGGFLYYRRSRRGGGDADDDADDDESESQPCAVHAFIGLVDAALPSGFDASSLGGTLSFQGPFSLDRLEIGDRLWNASRVHEVTDASLARQGVKKFGWISPAEVAPLPTALGYRAPLPTALGYRAPLPTAIGYRAPLPTALGYRAPLPTALGYRAPLPTALGYRAPLPTALGSRRRRWHPPRLTHTHALHTCNCVRALASLRRVHCVCLCYRSSTARTTRSSPTARAGRTVPSSSYTTTE